MNPNTAPEAQFAQAQPGPEAIPQPQAAPTPEVPGMTPMPTPGTEAPKFTITGPAEPIITPQVASAPEAPASPFFNAPEAASAPVAPAPLPEAAPQPQPQAYPSPDAQVAMAPNLGPDVAKPQPPTEPLTAPQAANSPEAPLPAPVTSIPTTQAETAALKAMDPGHAELLANDGEDLDKVISEQPQATAETSQNPDTEKRITDSLTFAQNAWEKAGRNTDPEFVQKAREAIKGALEKDLTEIMKSQWTAPTPEETWS